MENLGNRSRRRGIAVVYVIVTLIVMLGFCSLAVDLGRVQTSKTELRRACDAAARAGASFLPQGTASVQSEAITLAADNKVDDASLALTDSEVTVGYWTSAGGFTTAAQAGLTSANAVRVSVQQYPVPLLFGMVVGASTCDISATSIAALVAEPSSTTEYVSAHGNPWLAGEPAGTLGSVPDPGYDNPSANDVHPWKYDIANPAAVAAAVASAGSSGDYSIPEYPSKVESTDYSSDEPYGSPTEFGLTLTPGSIVSISIPENSSNEGNNQGLLTSGDGNTYANGDSDGTYAMYSDDAANPDLPQGTNTTSGTEHGLSNIVIPINSVVGVFMDQNGATYGADSTQETSESNAPSTPTGIDFATQTARDYTTLEPTLNQTFYVGDGQTSTGVQQLIVVPNNAYSLFLGTMDGHEWSNNVGGYTATITQYQIELVR